MSARAARSGSRRASSVELTADGTAENVPTVDATEPLAETVDEVAEPETTVPGSTVPEVEVSVAAGEPDGAGEQQSAENDSSTAVADAEPSLDDSEVVAEDLEVADTVGEHPAPAPQRETPRLAAHVDEQLIVRLAREALAEVTPERTIGGLRDVVLNADEAAAIVRFSTTQGGYPGWYWTVAVSAHEGVEPSVLEAELLPYEGALTAPEWVPWADRLEDYVAQQEAEAAERAARGEVDADADALDESDDDDADDDLDDDDLDDASDDDTEEDDDDEDEDDDVHEHDLHLDDVDGVDIDLHADDEEE